MLSFRITLQLSGMMLGYTELTPVNLKVSVIRGNTNFPPAAWITGISAPLLTESALVNAKS